MSRAEKLQRAIEVAIAAGYQLSREAFEFLNTTTTEDPSEVVSKAVRRLGTLKEKPLFIERSLLEDLVKDQKLIKDAVTQPLKEGPQPLEQQVTEGKKRYRPYAMEVEADIDVIEDPSSKLNPSGTLEGYLEYFRDRFRRLEKLLRQRVDVRGAMSVTDALKAPANAKLKVICMITEKRELKQRVFLTIEDLNTSAVALVPQNAPRELKEKVGLLLLDQVVCLSVIKTGGGLLLIDDVILPDVAQRQQNKAPIPIYAVLTSDIHIGSTKFQREAFSRFILWLNGKYGDRSMREIASRVKYVLIAGDIIDGIGIYPNQVKELAVRDLYEQYKLATKFIEQIPDYVEVVIIPGNHDASRKALPQPAISSAFLELLQGSRKIYSLGDPSILSLHSVEVLMYHGRSLDDVIPTTPGMDFEHPEKAMTLLLRGRHLAPVYGGKTPLSPESRDFLVIDRVPDIFHSGHIHTFGHANYHGVLVINSGCWQEQTDYIRRLGIVPMPNRVPVVDLQTLGVTVIPFS